jgi:phosphoglucomutase
VSELPEQITKKSATEDGYKISARPSGTEPKIKFYMSVNAPLDSLDKFDEVTNELDGVLDQIEDDLNR